MKIFENYLDENKNCHLECVKEVEWNKKCNSPLDIAGMLNTVFKASQLAEEHAWLICLTNSGAVNGLFELAKGTVSMSVVGIREIYIRALLCGAAGVVIAHNHPSGKLDPSKEDRALYRRLKECGELLQMPLEDFLIVSSGGYCSFMEKEF